MLADLIPDVLHIIFSLLDVPNFHPLRLTCGQLEQRSRAAFGATAFPKLRVDFSRANLEWMTDMASHEAFRLAAREWQVGHWEGRGNAWKLSREIALRDDEHQPRQASRCLDTDSELIKQFADLLSRFPNCTSDTHCYGQQG